MPKTCDSTEELLNNAHDDYDGKVSEYTVQSLLYTGLRSCRPVKVLITVHCRKHWNKAVEEGGMV